MAFQTNNNQSTKLGAKAILKRAIDGFAADDFKLKMFLCSGTFPTDSMWTHGADALGVISTNGFTITELTALVGPFADDVPEEAYYKQAGVLFGPRTTDAIVVTGAGIGLYDDDDVFLESVEIIPFDPPVTVEVGGYIAIDAYVGVRKSDRDIEMEIMNP